MKITNESIAVVFTVIIIAIFIALPSPKSVRVVEAIKDNNTPKALKLIEDSTAEELNKPTHGAVIDFFLSIIDADGADYPIIAAANANNLEVVDALIEKGVDLDVKDSVVENTALIEACDSISKDRFKTAIKLIDGGADVDATNYYEKRALDYVLVKDEATMDKTELVERAETIIKIVEHSEYYNDDDNYSKLKEELLFKKDADIVEILEQRL